MFFGHISTVNLSQYPKAIQLALEYLRDTDFNDIDAGRYVIKEDLIYAQVLDIKTKEKGEIHPEVHRNYIDVQYLHSGKECIGFAPDLGTNKEASMYDSCRDILFYHNADFENEIIMRPGNFIVFFPEDVHRPGCINGEVSNIRKVVVKIAMSEI